MKILDLFRRKVRTHKKMIGDKGERAAVSYLRRHGYRIVTRNFKHHLHEIDVIALEKRRMLVFIEVKTRTHSVDIYNRYGSAASAVGQDKQRSLVAGARAYLRRNPTDLPCRFDVIEVYLSKAERIIEINHIKEAFSA